jgi:multiple sugar transport system permease protein
MEAFEVDGGTRLQAILRIVLPLLVPSLAVACGLKVIESLKAFTEIYTMTGGGPGSSTTTLSMFIVREGTEYFHLPAAAAAGSLLLVSGIAMGVVYAIFQNRRRPVASRDMEKGAGI